jgi:hypothetical protein
LKQHGSGETYGDGTCWIKEDPNPDAINWFQLTFFIPLLGYFTMAIIALIYASLNRNRLKGESKLHRQLMFRMRLFVGVFVFFWTGTYSFSSRSCGLSVFILLLCIDTIHY